MIHIESCGAPETRWTRVIVNPADPQRFIFMTGIVRENSASRSAR